jgi:hypothetical protein
MKTSASVFMHYMVLRRRTGATLFASKSSGGGEFSSHSEKSFASG